MTIPGDVPEQVAPADTGPAPRQGALQWAKSRFADLGPRILSAVVLVIIAVTTLISGGVFFVLAWLAAALTVHLEWQKLIGGMRFMMRAVTGCCAIAAAAVLASANDTGLALLAVALGAAACGYIAERGRRGWSASGVLYAGCLVVAVIALRLSFPFGPRAVGWLFAVVWGTDVTAYFAGRIIGGPRVAPQISPSKTWAGTLVGAIGGAVLGSLFLFAAAYANQLDTPAPPLVLFLLGLITSAVAQGGDLFESWAKRCFGAKNSGSLLPGHGGLMDRVDGFIAAAVFVAILGTLRGFPSPAEGLFHWM